MIATRRRAGVPPSETPPSGDGCTGLVVGARARRLGTRGRLHTSAARPLRAPLSSGSRWRTQRRRRPDRVRGGSVDAGHLMRARPAHRARPARAARGLSQDSFAHRTSVPTTSPRLAPRREPQATAARKAPREPERAGRPRPSRSSRLWAQHRLRDDQSATSTRCDRTGPDARRPAHRSPRADEGRPRDAEGAAAVCR